MNQVVSALLFLRNCFTTYFQINTAKLGVFYKLMMKCFEWRVLATQQDQLLDTLDQNYSCIK